MILYLFVYLSIPNGESLGYMECYVAAISVFPLIIFLAPSGEIKNKFSSRLCKFFGDISYPIYITHYPIIYIYTAWAIDGKIPISKVYPISILTFLSCIALAYLTLKLYDIPVRKWIAKKLT